MPQCPQGCVCQYAHLTDLPISRWINYMQQKYSTTYLYANSDSDDNGDTFDAMESNESPYDGGYSTIPFIKQATCIIQEDTDIDQLIKILPNDMQALILLYTGIGKNKTGVLLYIINKY